MACIASAMLLGCSERFAQQKRSDKKPPASDIGPDGDFSTEKELKGDETVLLWPTGAPGALGQRVEDKPRIVAFLAPKKKEYGGLPYSLSRRRIS